MNYARINKILIPLAAIMCIIAAVTVMMPSPPVVNPDAHSPRQLITLERPAQQLTTLEKPVNGGMILLG